MLRNIAVAIAVLVWSTPEVVFASLTEVKDGLVWSYEYTSNGSQLLHVGNEAGNPMVTTIDRGYVVIPGALGGKNVTSIAPDAFLNCTWLNSISIPSTVMSIGENAFYGCTGLGSGVVIEDGCVLTVNESNTALCPENVDLVGARLIADGVFRNRKRIKTVTLRSSMVNVGTATFYGCTGITSFYVYEENKIYKAVNGLLLSKDGKELLCGITGAVSIPDGVISIADSAFSGMTLTSLSIPESVAKIGEGAFYNCQGLGEGVIVVDGCVLTIGGDCPSSVVLPNDTRVIADGVFRNCSALKSIQLPDSVKYIGLNAFSGCSGLGEGVVMIDDCVLTVNGDCPSSIDLSDARVIAEGVFNNCQGIKSVSLPMFVQNIIETFPVSYKTIERVVFHEGMLEIPDRACYECSSLKSVEIPSGVKSIGGKAFFGCKFLEFLNIPESVIGIGNYAFDQTGIRQLRVPKNVQTLCSLAFTRTDSLSMDVILECNRPSVISGGSLVFSGSIGIVPEYYYAWRALLSNNDSAKFRYTVYWELTCSPYYDGVTIDGTTITGTRVVEEKGPVNLSIPNALSGHDVVAVSPDAFSHYYSLSSITLPESVREIGADAFSYCPNLSTVTLSSSLVRIGTHAFSGLPSGCQYISADGVVKIGDWLIRVEQPSVGKFVVPSDVRHIADGAFSECAALTEVVLHENIESIGKDAFVGTKFWDFHEDGPVVLGGWLLGWKGDVTRDVVIPLTVMHIADSVFENQPNIEKVVLPLGVKTVGAYAFASCKNLESVTLDESSTIIGFRSFANCSEKISQKDEKIVGDCEVRFDATEGLASQNMRLVKKGATLGELPEARFEGGDFLGWFTAVDGGDQVSSETIINNNITFYAHWKQHPLMVHFKLGDYGFSRVAGGELFQSVEYGGYVKEPILDADAEWMFTGWDGDISQPIVKDMTFVAQAAEETFIQGSQRGIKWVLREGNGILQLSGTGEMYSAGMSSMYDWYPYRNGIKRIEIGEGFTSVGSGLCNGYTNLKTISLPSTVRSISSYAFQNCKSLESVYFPDGLTMVCGFEGCINLKEVVIPSSVTRIAPQTFMGCTGLECVVIPDGVLTIGSSAFKDCTKLECVKIGKGVEFVDLKTFYNCGALRRIEIPANVTSIDSSAFQLCHSLDVVFRGDAPEVLYAPFLLGEDCRAKVGKKSKGWGVNLPGKWNNFAIAYGDDCRIRCVAGEGLPNQYVVRAQGDTIGELPTIERWGYEFLGWYSLPDGGEKIDAAAKVSEDMVLYAHWRLHDFKVSFNAAGGSGVSPITRPYGEVLGELPVPVRNGYDFLGWYSSPQSGDRISKNTLVRQDVECYAHWSANPCTITFDFCGFGDAIKRIVSFDEKIGELPTCSSRTGYDFLGWFTAKDGGVRITSDECCSGSTTYYAHWVIKSYQVIFDANGGDEDTVLFYEHGASFGSGLTPNRIGHAFIGWFTLANGGNQISTSYQVSSDMTVYAHWKANVYCISLDSNGGDAIPSVTMEYGMLFDSLPTPSREGYKFDGWYTQKEGGEKVQSSWFVQDNVIYYAHWRLKQNYMLTFDFNDGSGDSEVLTLEEGTRITPVSSPTRRGYDFVGWYSEKDGGIALTDDTIISGDCVFYAHWNAHVYTVCFDPNDGTVSSCVNIEYGKQIGALPEPSRFGYVLLGWFSGRNEGLRISGEEIVSADVTYYAHWARKKFHVVFDLGTCGLERIGGGELEQEVSYCDIAIAPEVRSPKGFIFMGWTPIETKQIMADTTFTARCGVCSGKSGDVTWSYDEDSKTMTYSGAGDMGAIEDLDSESWAYCRERARVLNVEKEVRSVPITAASGFHAIEEARIGTPIADFGSPDSYYPLRGCGKLVRLELTEVAECLGWLFGRYKFDGASPLVKYDIYSLYVPDSLREVVVTDSLVLGEDAFRNFNVLTSIKLPDKMTTIGPCAFFYCEGLTAIDLPEGITTIGRGAFCGCTGLISLNIPSGITKIDSSVFQLCSSLSALVIPSGVMSIGEFAFKGCAKLKSLTFLGDAPTIDGDVSTVFIGVPADMKVRISRAAKGWGTVPGTWNGFELEYMECFPMLNKDASAEQLKDALLGAADSALAENITEIGTYEMFLRWANSIVDSSGRLSGREAVWNSECAWVSFALDAAALLGRNPTDADLIIEEFKPTEEDGRFEFAVSVKDVEVGSAALAENLKKVFGLTGATTLDVGSFMPENVEVEFDAPKDGKLKFTAKPAKKSDRFFMRVKVK